VKSLAVAVALLVSATACGDAPKPADRRSSSSAAGASSPGVAPPLPTSYDDATHAGVAEDAGARSTDAPLSDLGAALDDLQRGARGAHVHVLFMGDSHTRADFLSGTVRDALQARFGNGGPGFVHVGMHKYRHHSVKLGVEGVWTTLPKSPSTTLRSGDGILGLGGTLTRGKSGPLRATLKPHADYEGELLWDFCYRTTKPTDRIRLAPEGAPSRSLTGIEEQNASLSPIRHETLRTKPPHRITVEIERGEPSLCGVVIQRDPEKSPGVVVHTLGIDGAAYGTPLAWNESAWAREVQRHAPSLFVLEYGTNEASDRSARPEEVAAHLRALVERARRAAPAASCLVVSPTDRSDREAKVYELERAYGREARRLSCHYWDVYRVMGGRGSMKRHQEMDPPRAASDGIHFTRLGYEELGQRMFADMLRAAGIAAL